MAAKSKDARMRFVANVERRREELGCSREELAERAGVEGARLEAILRGDAEAHVDSVYRLAGALGVSPGTLYEGVAWVPDGDGGGEYRVDDRREH
ncbi:MAG TPA: helix-turn-helix transcriptional regulator [Solirubrobacterales bacterium]|nr:helix-turn-helix transcriptional regulator [Solirubrobacterales bacterium]